MSEDYYSDEDYDQEYAEGYSAYRDNHEGYNAGYGDGYTDGFGDGYTEGNDDREVIYIDDYYIDDGNPRHVAPQNIPATEWDKKMDNYIMNGCTMVIAVAFVILFVWCCV